MAVSPQSATGIRDIQFKLCLMMYKAMHGLAPAYLSELCAIKCLCWRSNSVVCSGRPCSSADEDKVRRTCIRRRRSGGMEPVAVLRSQLSVLGHAVSRRRWRHFSSLLTPHFLSSCCCMHCMYGALESVAVLWRHIEVIVTLLLLLLLAFLLAQSAW